VSPKKSSVRLATAAQLWVLNRADWVELREKPDATREVTNSQADATIKESLRRQEQSE
jgi:hypothetical protein